MDWNMCIRTLRSPDAASLTPSRASLFPNNQAKDKIWSSLRECRPRTHWLQLFQQGRRSFQPPQGVRCRPVETFPFSVRDWTLRTQGSNHVFHLFQQHYQQKRLQHSVKVTQHHRMTNRAHLQICFFFFFVTTSRVAVMMIYSCVILVARHPISHDVFLTLFML